MGSIIVDNLGKAYKTYPNQGARLAEWVLPGSKPRHSLKWVLQNVSFQINPGEAVGIVGINGAGKSTLLKMITGTTQPTTGSVEIHGRVAAMLELGMGFHPDFTGRQNAYMAGQILGYSVEDITRLMPQISAFAEIGDYLDSPVRVYSSGMQMRLAFSVATANRPDILIVDEALSVGDAYFQHKSLDRIREFAKQGTTLLIVSHDTGAIQAICDRAILLSQGKVAMEGNPEEIMDYYNAMLADHQGQIVRQEKIEGGKTRTISGTGEVTVDSVTLYNTSGDNIEIVRVGEAVILRILVTTKDPIEKLVLGIGIKDRLGQVMYGTNTDLTQQAIFNVKANAEIIYEFSFNASLGPGEYSVQTALTNGATHLERNYEWRDLALIFKIINTTASQFAGCNWLNAEILIKKL